MLIGRTNNCTLSLDGIMSRQVLGCLKADEGETREDGFAAGSWVCHCRLMPCTKIFNVTAFDRLGGGGAKERAVTNSNRLLRGKREKAYVGLSTNST